MSCAKRQVPENVTGAEFLGIRVKSLGNLLGVWSGACGEEGWEVGRERCLASWQA